MMWSLFDMLVPWRVGDDVFAGQTRPVPGADSLLASNILRKRVAIDPLAAETGSRDAAERYRAVLRDLNC